MTKKNDLAPTPSYNSGTARPPVGPLHNLSVLCIYNNPLFLDRICRFLENDGDIFVEISISAEDALHLLIYIFFDVIVTDCMFFLGEKNGLVKIVRKQGQNVPFIYFAREFDPAVISEAADLGRISILPYGDTQADPALENLRRLVRTTAHQNLQAVPAD